MEADANEFDDITKEKNYILRPVNKVKELDENLPGLGEQRAIVQWAFNEERAVGDIDRFSTSEGYAVVQVTKRYNKGLMSPEDASATVLPILRKDIKADQIMAANKGKSMEQIIQESGASKNTVSAITMKAPTLAGAGSEPAVVGTAFALEVGQTSGLIKGETGVFLVKVLSKNEAIKLPNFSTFANTLTTTTRSKANTTAYEALKKGAEIDDFRGDFY
jgi:peptidyl-prolyl cis-trans isomerase D